MSLDEKQKNVSVVYQITIKRETTPAPDTLVRLQWSLPVSELRRAAKDDKRRKHAGKSAKKIKTQ